MDKYDMGTKLGYATMHDSCLEIILLCHDVVAVPPNQLDAGWQ